MLANQHTAGVWEWITKTECVLSAGLYLQQTNIARQKHARQNVKVN